MLYPSTDTHDPVLSIQMYAPLLLGLEIPCRVSRVVTPHWPFQEYSADPWNRKHFTEIIAES